ncbi:MAG: ATP-binding protein [Aggregatilineales bacterium]
MSDQYDLIHQNRMLNEEIKRRVDQISAINAVAAAVGQSLDLNQTLDTALQAVVSVVGTEAAGISLIDNATGDVVLRAQYGWTNDFVKRNPMRIPRGEGMSGQVIKTDDVIIYNHLKGDENYAVPGFGKEDFKALAMAPMHASGEIIGILSVMNHDPDSFDDALVTVLRSIADTVGVAVDNARLHEKHVEQENRLKAILFSTEEGIIATDQNSKIRLVNDAAANMLDVRAEDLPGIPLREAPINNNVRDKLLEALANEQMGMETQSVQVSLPMRELSVLVSPVKVQSQIAEDAEQDGWVIVLRDVTYMRQEEIARVQFIQAAAHDMKNPLGVTISSLHMLEGMIPRDENTREVVDIARTALRRLQRLIDDLLHIEQIQSGYGFNQESVDIREMLYEVTAQMSPLFASRGIKSEVEIADDIPVLLWMDLEWMQRALNNYMENAAKYASDNESALVKLKVYIEDDKLRFEVIDNGPGIPPRAKGHIFDRFYRVENRRDVQGSGLGLAIVKSVAEAHHGEVYVRSEIDQGSTFGIWIPLIVKEIQDIEDAPQKA